MTALAPTPLPQAPVSTPIGRRPLTVLEIGAEWFAELGGGLNRYYGDLLRHLPASGVAYRGLVAGSAAKVNDPDVRPFSPIAAPLRRRWFAEWQALRKELASVKFDLVASHFSPYAVPLLVRPSWLLGHLPHVVHFHGPWADESRRDRGGRFGPAVKAGLERLVYRSADRLIVLSEAFAAVLRESYGVRADRIRVVPGGIECQRYEIETPRPEARRQLGWPTDRPIVLTVRRLVRRMGLEHLVAAVASLRTRVPDVLVLIAGNGAMRQELAAQIASSGLTDHVRLLGFLPDDNLPLAYRAADVTVVPSVALEGFGLVAVESLAAGTPAIVTRVGGLPEVVAGLSDRLVVPPASPPALATALAEILGDGPGPWPTAEECRSHVRANFDWSRVADRIADIYADVAH